MFRKLAAFFASVALACSPALVFAAPVPYLTGPLDIPRVEVNNAILAINNSQASAAILNTYSGASPISTTLNSLRFTVTITGLTTAASTLSAAQTVTDSYITASTQVLCSPEGYAGTGVPVVVNVTPAAGSVTFAILNVSTGAALNANVVVACLAFT